MKHLLLLHGAIGSRVQLNPLAELLREDYEVHSFNFTGHGGRDIPGEPFSIELFASETASYIKENGLSEVCVFGYSMGGYVALYMASHYPGLVSGIFILATKFEWTPETAVHETGMLDPVRITAKIPAFAQTLQDRHYPADWKTVLSKTAEMMVAMGKANPLSASDLSGLEIPVRLSLGDRDKMVSMEETLSVYKQLKNATFLVMPATPHAIESTDLSRLAFELKNFFRIQDTGFRG